MIDIKTIGFLLAVLPVVANAATTIRTDNTENVKTIPIQSPSATLARAKNVYCVPVSLKKGDIVMVSGQAEVTTEQSHPVMVASLVALGETCYQIDIRLTKPVGTNITREIHHHVISINGASIMLDDYVGYASFQVYAAYKYGTGFLKVEQNYGNMNLVVIRQ